MRNLRRYRPVAVVLVVLHLSACTTWQAVPVQAGPVSGKMRITTQNELVVLNNTRLVGDTVVEGTWASERVGIPRTFRLTEITLMERSKTSFLKTFLLVYVLVGAVGYAIACANAPPDNYFC